MEKYIVAIFIVSALMLTDVIQMRITNYLQKTEHSEDDGHNHGKRRWAEHTCR